MDRRICIVSEIPNIGVRMTRLGVGAEVVDTELDDEDHRESVLRPVAAPSFRRLLGSSLLWAIPVSYLACSGSVTVAVVIGMLGDGYDASSSSFVSAVMVGFFLWGTMIFVATTTSPFRLLR